jgi:hypothetical protein
MWSTPGTEQGLTELPKPSGFGALLGQDCHLVGTRVHAPVNSSTNQYPQISACAGSQRLGARRSQAQAL